MKKSLSLLVLLGLTLCSLRAQVTFRFHSGLNDPTLKTTMERRISGLLTELNAAADADRDLQLSSFNLTPTASKRLAFLWKTIHFRCEDEQNVEKCLTDVNGYEVRNLPVNIVSDDYDEERHRELFISFSADGEITSVHLALASNVYHDIVNRGQDLTDSRRRLEILKFVEDFRSYYDEKDIEALDQVYSEDALIITGKVVMRKQMVNDQPRLKPEIVYSKKNKEQYMTSLRKTFATNKYIKVTFTDIEVFKHPAKENFYGVTLHQHWKSSNYEDDGYIFLLWEFKDDENEPPTIHVRTWQPDKVGGKTLSKKEKFNINDFFIP